MFNCLFIWQFRYLHSILKASQANLAMQVPLKHYYATTAYHNRNSNNKIAKMHFYLLLAQASTYREMFLRENLFKQILSLLL